MPDNAVVRPERAHSRPKALKLLMSALRRKQTLQLRRKRRRTGHFTDTAGEYVWRQSDLHAPLA